VVDEEMSWVLLRLGRFDGGCPCRRDGPLSPASILADGISTAAVTGTVTDSNGVGIGGERIMLSAPSDAGLKFS
jgi:hypothetical protein